MDKTTIYKRLYKDYSKKYLNKIIISAFFSILVAGSTSAIAWLLDPAIKKIFIEKDQSFINFNTFFDYICIYNKRYIFILRKSNNDWCWRRSLLKKITI